MEHTIPVVTVIGRSGSGKTTLLEKVVGTLTVRGHRVGTVKHHSHRGFEIDRPGKDSWRMAQAGSRHVVVAAPDRIAAYRDLDRELTLGEIIAEIRDVDVILVEGYRDSGLPHIEVLRAAHSTELIGDPAARIALVTDVPHTLGVPSFALDDVAGVVRFIEELFLTPGAHARSRRT